jgi:hypothetical protein
MMAGSKGRKEQKPELKVVKGKAKGDEASRNPAIRSPIQPPLHLPKPEPKPEPANVKHLHVVTGDDPDDAA